MRVKSERKSVWLVALKFVLALALGWDAASAQTVAHGATPPKGGLGEAPRELKATETIRFPFPSPTVALLWMPCNAEGDIYAVYDTASVRGLTAPPNPTLLPIRELLPDSQTVKEFPVRPLDGYPSSYRVGFNLGPRGHVYGLFIAYRHPHALAQGGGVPVVVKYNDDGSVDSQIKLSGYPSGVLQATVFGVFGDGNFLVTGVLDASSPAQAAKRHYAPPPKGVVVHQPPPGLRPFTGIFDHSGNFLQEMRLPWDVGPGSQASATAARQTGSGHSAGARSNGHHRPEAPPNFASDWLTDLNQTLVVSGTEDNMYLLRPSSPVLLYEISSGGQVTRDVRVKLPARGVRPTEMSRAGNTSMLIAFSGTRVDRKGRVRTITVFAVVDPVTGRITAAYRLPPNANLMPTACAVGPGDFEFVGSTKSSKLKIVKYYPN
jgi:hypothetical protein